MESSSQVLGHAPGNPPLAEVVKLDRGEHPEAASWYSLFEGSGSLYVSGLSNIFSRRAPLAVRFRIIRRC